VVLTASGAVFCGAANAAGNDDDDARLECGQSVHRSQDGDDSEESPDDFYGDGGNADSSERYAPQSCGGRGGAPGVNSAVCGSRFTPSGPVHDCRSPRAQRGADG
jgi:hypothetical protein